ncbi:MAG: hypothetical protein SPL62_11595, partial [Selenomonas sp.]|nr:hypothetical protein [Selenomonas sp.]
MRLLQSALLTASSEREPFHIYDNVCSISPIFQLAWQTDNIDTNFCLPSRIGSGGILDGKIV